MSKELQIAVIVIAAVSGLYTLYTIWKNHP